MAPHLYSLAERLRVGDNVQWKGTASDVGRQRPKKVTRIEHGDGSIKVFGVGPDDGRYWFEVSELGDSKAVFVDPEKGEEPKGEVEIARLVWPGEGYISV